MRGGGGLISTSQSTWSHGLADVTMSMYQFLAEKKVKVEEGSLVEKRTSLLLSDVVSIFIPFDQCLTRSRLT